MKLSARSRYEHDRFLIQSRAEQRERGGEAAMRVNRLRAGHRKLEGDVGDYLRTHPQALCAKRWEGEE